MPFSKMHLQDIVNSPFEDTFKPDHQLGPDYLIPTNKFRTWHPEEATVIKITKNEPDVQQPISFITLLENNVKKCPDSKALSVKRNGQWKDWTYSQYWKESHTVAKAFIKLGLERYDSIAILGFNSPEWFMSYFGAILAGGVSIGIYLSNSPSACLYVLEHSHAKIIIVDGEQQLKKILQIQNQLPYLNAIIQYGDTPTHEDIFSWNDILKIGESMSDDILNKRTRNLAINQCCSMIYTSGTTGNPKAVMLNHHNYVYLYWELLKRDLHPVPFHENASIVSYLPLNHIAAQAMDLCIMLMLEGHVSFAQPDAFRGSLISTLQEVRPTIFAGVPRMYEKMKEKIDEKLASLNWISKFVIMWALSCVRTFTKSQLSKNPYKPYGYFIANKIICGLKEKLGLQKALYFISGGAPLSPETHEMLTGLGIVVNDCYGLSETAGAHVMSTPQNYRLNSAGKSSGLNEIKIDNPSSNGEGEILLSGRNVFMGYMFDKEKTMDAIDNEGFFHSGDIGKLDNDGFLFITGRIKELLITSGGENIAPCPIEDAVKAELPIVSQAILVGDRKKFLSMLLTLKTNVDPDTQDPLNSLSELSINWCKALGSNAKSLDDIIKVADTKVMAAIQKGIDKVNQRAVSNACRIQKWKILARDLTVQDDELGPTLKLKRYIIHKKYNDIINSMYT